MNLGTDAIKMSYGIVNALRSVEMVSELLSEINCLGNGDCDITTFTPTDAEHKIICDLHNENEIITNRLNEQLDINCKLSTLRFFIPAEDVACLLNDSEYYVEHKKTAIGNFIKNNIVKNKSLNAKFNDFVIEHMVDYRDKPELQMNGVVTIKYIEYSDGLELFNKTGNNKLKDSSICLYRFDAVYDPLNEIRECTTDQNRIYKICNKVDQNSFVYLGATIEKNDNIAEMIQNELTDHFRTKYRDRKLTQEEIINVNFRHNAFVQNLQKNINDIPRLDYRILREFSKPNPTVAVISGCHNRVLPVYTIRIYLNGELLIEHFIEFRDKTFNKYIIDFFEELDKVFNSKSPNAESEIISDMMFEINKPIIGWGEW